MKWSGNRASGVLTQIASYFKNSSEEGRRSHYSIPKTPYCSDDIWILAAPVVILKRKLVKRGNRAVIHVLVEWANLPKEEAIWEDYALLKLEFLKCDPKGWRGRVLYDVGWNATIIIMTSNSVSGPGYFWIIGPHGFRVSYLNYSIFIFSPVEYCYFHSLTALGQLGRIDVVQ